MKRLLSLALFLALVWSGALPAQSSNDVIDRLPKGEQWTSHLLNDLMPFWNMEAALGSPAGAFPGTRCDNGSLYDPAQPCPEVRNVTWIQPANRYLVSLSRQTYAYGVLFHMTGDSTWLEYMKAGVNYIRNNSVDRQQGGMATTWDASQDAWGPKAEFRNPQELGYGLLGLSFYYYLTRDPAVLPDILAIKDYILGPYYNSSKGALQWMLADNGNNPAENFQLTAQLDQMNAYMVLMTPLLSEPQQSAWKDSLSALAHILISNFYNPDENLFFLSSNRPEDLDLAYSGTDFGHTIKAMWMIRMAGLITGEQDLVDFAESNGRRVLERAYLPDSGSWAQSIQKGGGIDIGKSWWIYCELDQFSASLALRDPSVATRLPETYDYWLRFFIDHDYGEVWNGVDGKTNRPVRDLPKQWQWKNGYHSLEHALVAYITSQQLHGEPVILYYAFSKRPEDAQLRPYFYTGTIDRATPKADSRAGTVWEVVFRDVR